MRFLRNIELNLSCVAICIDLITLCVILYPALFTSDKFDCVFLACFCALFREALSCSSSTSSCCMDWYSHRESKPPP